VVGATLENVDLMGNCFGRRRIHLQGIADRKDFDSQICARVHVCSLQNVVEQYAFSLSLSPVIPNPVDCAKRPDTQLALEAAPKVERFCLTVLTTQRIISHEELGGVGTRPLEILTQPEAMLQIGWRRDICR
jgi:hypothetical protein